MSLTTQPWPWPWIAGGLAVAITVATGAWWLTRRRAHDDPPPDRRLVADAQDPYRRWVQSVFMLVTGPVDYAHLGGNEARRILAHWWGVYGPLELRRVLLELSTTRARDCAWDLVRFTLVSRLGVAAGMLPEEVSWAEILPVARRLQAAYSDWRPMARAYVQARRQWRQLPLDGSGDDDDMTQILDNLARLDDTRWKEQAFGVELRLPEPGDSDG